MKEFAEMSVEQAQYYLEHKQARLVDIRDPQSFLVAHPKGAYHLTDASLLHFMEETESEQPILVICYHGNSSRGAAQYLISQGFDEVYSLTGGFVAWQQAQLPIEQG